MSTTADPRAKLPDTPLADNERLKGQSRHLRGTIAEDLNDGLTGGFNGDNFQLIRFHGMYEQDNRDIRAERNEQKLEGLKNVMIRCRLPGGVITPKQWLGIDEFADSHTLYNSIRLTNRQTFQYHGVLKPDIKAVHQWLNKLGLDTIATAGDVNRNVLCTSNPIESGLHKEAHEWAKKISEHLLPKTRAYAEIWLDGEKVESTENTGNAPLPEAVKSGDAAEPVLGGNYLPRKFKTTVVIPPHNDVDLHANDLNFVAIEENGRLAGFNVLVGGGLSIEHGNHKTYPNTAREFGFIGLDKVLDCAAAVVSVQRENSMACVALPTCPLAMAEAERFLPAFIDHVDGLMAKHGLSEEHIVLRVNGCPNGCGRTMLSEIGLVGKAVGRYNLYAGGNREGTRIPRLFKENITEPEILQILDDWIGAWAQGRLKDEGFGDFAVRTGIVKPVLDAPRDFWSA